MQHLRRPWLNNTYDIAVLGSGFAGSIFAMIARRQGRSVILLERGRHPRTVIGESSTPLSNLLLEELAQRYDLPGLLPLSKWGTWQKQHPELPCGLKRGFSFFHHDLTRPQVWKATPANHFLVAASPHNAIADTHWYRAGFDHLLVQQAQQLGVDYRDEWSAHRLTQTENSVALTGTQRGKEQTLRASFVVDATGPRGCLHHLLQLSESRFANYPATQALYSHFSGVAPLAGLPADGQSSKLPYPVEAAAIHHIMDNGWVWLLHFNNGITSAGIAATRPFADRLLLSEGQPAWERLLQQAPSLAAQFSTAQAVLPFTYLPQLPFRSAAVAGKRWALLPSAAGFVDPLLSTGFPLTLLGIRRLAGLLEEHWNRPTLRGQLTAYAAHTHDELDATARLIAALYANMHNFAVFRAVSLLYFAAASFSEAAQRLEKAHLAQGFLLHDDPHFGPRSRRLLDQAQCGIANKDTACFIEEIHAAIEPFDIAGLCAEHPMPWYPVEADDLRNAAGKLSATEEEVTRLLRRSGFYPATPSR